jgi:hypothetical protein
VESKYVGLYMDSVGCDKVYSRKQIKSIDIKKRFNFHLFCIKYTTSVCKKRKHLYFRDERAHRKANLTAELIQEHDKPTIKAL